VTRLADAIVHVLHRERVDPDASPPATPQPEPAAPLPAFSGSARIALTHAANMLAGLDVSPARQRSAALISALLTTATRGMAPTSGDVVRLIEKRQRDKRSIVQALEAASAAVGLNNVDAASSARMSVDALAASAAGELVLDASDMQRRTRSDGVHLRHVLATGVHPAVPAGVLAELRVTMADVRDEWRASIERTWPDESDGWNDILLVKIAGERFDTTPPTALVHRDRWTVDDALDYALYAKAISQFIAYPDPSPPLVISVQAPWGQGKTSLMRMVQRNLDPEHPDLLDVDSPKRASDREDRPSEVKVHDLLDAMEGKVTPDAPKPRVVRTVWFNAWKYQSSEQIWAGLADAILSQLPRDSRSCNASFLAAPSAPAH
jgi:hypothetical protein